MTLPEAFKLFYLANNGQKDDGDGLVPAKDILDGDFYMMPLSEILSDWRMMNELVEVGEFDNSRVRSALAEIGKHARNLSGFGTHHR